ncbi:MAG: dTMP kinase [Acidobacteriota bacterium]
MPGHVIAFEGLDQSGKQTQAERLAAALRARHHTVHLLSFPDYQTAIGQEIGAALRGGREYAPDALQLLYIANRYEFRPKMEAWLKAGAVILCDRYTASSVAYGEAQGVDPTWLVDVQRRLPHASLTLLLDIAPEDSLERKQADRDRFERDLPLLARVRASYRRQAAEDDWVVLQGHRDKNDVTDDVIEAVRARLGLL